MWGDFRLIIQSEVSIHIKQIATPRFVTRQVWPWEIKRATSLFNSSCCNIAKQVAHFVACFTIAYRCYWCIYVVLWEHTMNVHQAESCWRTSVLIFVYFFVKTRKRAQQILLSKGRSNRVLAKSSTHLLKCCDR